MRREIIATWDVIAYNEILKMAKEDKKYLDLMADLEQKETEYTAMLGSLTPDQQKTIEDYIMAIENVDYRMMQLANECEPYGTSWVNGKPE